MTLLARLVATSQSVGANSSRLAKIRELAACLAALEPAEIETGVLYLSGEPAQGKLGIGFAALRSASTEPTASTPELTIAQVDARLDALARTRGTGAATQRIVELRALFVRATEPEREFLVRLLLGELRQGALAGVMIEAIAAAS